MAKKRKSILDAETSEIKNVGKSIMPSTPPPSPIEKDKSPKSKKTIKNKMVYLDEEVHKEARVKASMSGKTIKKFITDLIKSFETE